MLVVMHSHSTPAQIERVLETIRQMGLTPHPMPGATPHGDRNHGQHGRGRSPHDRSPARSSRAAARDQAVQARQPRNARARHRRPAAPRQLSASAIHDHRRAVLSRGRGDHPAHGGMADGPRHPLPARGAFKPRTSPYAFQGLGLEGLEILRRVREKTGIAIVTELMDTENADAVEAVADVIQIGTRNMQNFSLLRRVARARQPVLLKRGMSATLEEWLMSAEYLLSGGNDNVILCERGVRTFSDHSRNTLDLSVIPPAKALSHLPILVDPSHGTGKRDYVPPMALAALAAGADGLLIEVHPDPDHAISDGAQSLDFDRFEQLLTQLRTLSEPLGHRSKTLAV